MAEQIAVPFENREIRIAYESTVRSDDWLICLHGIQSNRRLFENVPTTPGFDNYSVLAFDAVGFGDSDKPADFSYSIADQAQLTSTLLQLANINRAYILGHSLGGMIGTRLLVDPKLEVRGFINCEGNLTVEDAGLSKEIAHQSFDYFSAISYPRIKQDLQSSSEHNASLRNEWLKSVPDYVMYRTCHAIIEQSQDPAFAEMFFATNSLRMYIYGDKNASKAERVPSLPGLEKVSIPNSGHFMLLDNPTFAYNAIAHFLSNST